jgi:hypothetical protein
MPRLTERTIAYIILTALAVTGLFLVYWMYEGQSVQAQGTYELVMVFPENGEDGPDNFGETFAPCRNQGNCNFSCGPATVGRGCSTLVCTGDGNGDAAYFYTHSYACIYTPPACSTTPDSSCAADTCSTETCQATAADCSTYSIPGTKNCNAPPTCQDLDISLWGDYPPNCYFPTCQQLGNCPVDQPTCQDIDANYWGDYPPNCYYPTCQQLGNCPVDQPTCQDLDISLWGDYPPNCYFPTCQQLGYDGGTAPNGCYNDPTPSCADSGKVGVYPDCSEPSGGSPAPTATLTANPNPASGNTALTWTSTDTTSCTGVGTSFSTGGARNGTDPTVTPGFTYQVQCTGPGGNTTAQVAVGLIGGACSDDSNSLTITASPSRIQSGDNVTLSWSAGSITAPSCRVTNLTTNTQIDSANAASCAVGNETTSVTNVQAQTTYRLTCGTLTKDVTVNVVPRYEEF